MFKYDCLAGAGLQAVIAEDAAAVIDCFILTVDALGFADPLADGTPRTILFLKIELAE
jgi:hypothetical protein